MSRYSVVRRYCYAIVQRMHFEPSVCTAHNAAIVETYAVKSAVIMMPFEITNPGITSCESSGTAGVMSGYAAIIYASAADLRIR